MGIGQVAFPDRPLDARRCIDQFELRDWTRNRVSVTSRTTVR